MDKGKIVNNVSMGLLGILFVMFVSLPLYATEYTTEVVEVPAGKKIVLVDENAPMACFSVKGWKLHPLPTEVTQECERKLVISPGVTDEECVED